MPCRVPILSLLNVTPPPKRPIITPSRDIADVIADMIKGCQNRPETVSNGNESILPSIEKASDEPKLSHKKSYFETIMNPVDKEPNPAEWIFHYPGHIMVGSCTIKKE